MKLLIAIAALAALVTLTGCDRGTSGGPGATSPPSTTSITGQTEDTFSLDVPTTSIHQGESKTITIGINRGQNFAQDVSLKMDTLPKGITLDPAMPTIAQGDAETEVTVTAAMDAALGDFTVSVTGQPTKGAAAVVEMKLTVDEYDPDAAAKAIDDAAEGKWDAHTEEMEVRLARLIAAQEALQARAIDATELEKLQLEIEADRANVHIDEVKAELAARAAAGDEGWQKTRDSAAGVFGSQQ